MNLYLTDNGETAGMTFYRKEFLENKFTTV